MTFPGVFPSETATVYRGYGATKTSLGTLSVHKQPLTTREIAAGGGLYPIRSWHCFVDGALTIAVKIGDFLQITESSVTTDYRVIDVKEHTGGLPIEYSDIIVSGVPG